MARSYVAIINRVPAIPNLLSAVSHGLGLTLYQHAVDDKTNEITAIE